MHRLSLARIFPILALCITCVHSVRADEASHVKPFVYLWLEPEWFPDVKGRFAYWPGPAAASFKPTGSWGIAGPGISAEWSTGGESEWNSMGASPQETNAVASREIIVPRAGKYRVWVRYYDHRNKTEPFSVKIEQNGKTAVAGELGVKPVVPPNDEYQLYWGFSFGWGSVQGNLGEGPAKLSLVIDKPGEAWRQVDAVLVTDDLAYVPVGREKPPFAYFKSFGQQAKDGASWRGSGIAFQPPSKRRQIAGADFTMWAPLETSAKWWASQDPAKLTSRDVIFEAAAAPDIRKIFLEQFPGGKDAPIVGWPGLRPGYHIGLPVDLSPESNVFKWLLASKMPFYLMTNYAAHPWTEKTGPAAHAALTGPLKDQFLGFIHGEAEGSVGVGQGFDKLPATSRRERLDAMAKALKSQQAEQWTKLMHMPAPVSEDLWNKGIPCISCQTIAMSHLFCEMGTETLGYEVDSTNIHVPMRIAFERGAARQYGRNWINYASGNFGDACNYFTQQPVVPRGAPSWWHSKYAITDGVSIAWYRKLYYLNYLSGANAIYWEQGLTNQWIKPGPGTHPVQLSPFGRATEDFMAAVSRIPDRGEPITPVAFLLNWGHGYESVNYSCKMLDTFPENANDRELRELFNVAWYPTAISEGMPQAPDVQSMPNGVYGNIFDVLVDRPGHADAIMGYPIVWAAGDVQLDDKWMPALEKYLNNGGTLVVNVEAARGKAVEKFLGVKLTGKKEPASTWSTSRDAKAAETVPFELENVELGTAKPLAFANAGAPIITHNAVGKGAVILTLVPHMTGLDERAHPALPWLMNGLTQDLLPVEVVMSDGSRPSGRVMYQINRTKSGYLVGLFNNLGVDKTQNGIARVDRREVVDVLIRTKQPVKSAKEYTQPRELAPLKISGFTDIPIRVTPGDVQVVEVVTQ